MGKFHSVLSSFLLSSLPSTEFDRSLAIAAGFLRRHKTRVTTYEKLRLIRGIGDSIANKIVEIVQTGELSLLSYFQVALRLIPQIAGSHRKLENELPQENCEIVVWNLRFATLLFSSPSSVSETGDRMCRYRIGSWT